EHGWYLNNTTEENESKVKEYFRRISSHPRKIVRALRDCNVEYFVPLRILLEALELNCEQWFKNAKTDYTEANSTQSQEIQLINKVNKRIRNFWTAEDFEYAVYAAEKVVRSMPRAARHRILGLLVRIFVNNFDPNSSSPTSSDKKKTKILSAYHGIHKHNEEAAELLHRHTLLVRFFAAIPGDLMMMTGSAKPTTTTSIARRGQQGTTSTSSSGGGLFIDVLENDCFVEFDEVCRSLWFSLLQEDDQAPFSDDHEFLALSSFEEVGKPKQQLEVDKIDPLSPTQRFLSQKRLETVNRLLARQKPVNLACGSRVLCVGLSRMLYIASRRQEM
ncbi:unnamed protein product, partial [Amoebophrya sp. A25]